MVSYDTLILLYRWAEWHSKRMSVRCNLAACEKIPNPRGDTIDPIYIKTSRATAPRHTSKLEDVTTCILELTKPEQELVCAFAFSPQTDEGLAQWQRWITRRGRGYVRLRKSLRKLEQNLAKRGLV